MEDPEPEVPLRDTWNGSQSPNDPWKNSRSPNDHWKSSQGPPDPWKGSNGAESRCCGVMACKYLFCFYNLILMVCGGLVLGLGVWTLLDKGIFIYLISIITYKVTFCLLVCAGGAAILSVILGYIAIATENRYMLACYTILLVLVFMFDSITGLMAYVYQYKDQVDLDLNQNLVESFVQNYGIDPTVTVSVDKIQQDFKCCGANSFLDWNFSSWKEDNPGHEVPDSCCKTQTTDCGIRNHPSNIPYTGCIHRFSDELKEHLFLVGIVTLSLAVLQVIGVLITSCLFSRLRDIKKYEAVRTKQDFRHEREPL